MRSGATASVERRDRRRRWRIGSEWGRKRLADRTFQGRIPATERPAGAPGAGVQAMPQAIDISGPISADGARVLTREALAFVGELEARFGPVRASLLERRRRRDAEIAAGASYGLLAETAAVRNAEWK